MYEYTQPIWFKQLLDEKTEKNNSMATRSVDFTPEIIHENPTQISPRRKTPQSNIKAKRVVEWKYCHSSKQP